MRGNRPTADQRSAAPGAAELTASRRSGPSNAIVGPQALASAASRESILDAAERTFAELGYDRASISTICKRSGLPAGSLYHHFKSKLGLLTAVLERGQRRYLEMMPRPDDLSLDADTSIKAYWAAAAAAITDNVSLFYLENDLARFGQDDPSLAALIERSRDSAVASLGAVIERYARAHGVTEPKDLTRRLVDMIITFTRGAIIEAGRDSNHLGDMLDQMYTVVQLMTQDARPGDSLRM